MNLIDWNTASVDARRAALARPAADSREQVFAQAAAIVAAVRAEGDAAVRRFTTRFGGPQLDALRVTPQEFRDARDALEPGQIAALERAVANVTLSTTPARLDCTTYPESRATTASMPVPTSGDSDLINGTACRCMFEPINARFASSCSKKGTNAVATLTTCLGDTSIYSTLSGAAVMKSPP